LSEPGGNHQNFTPFTSNAGHNHANVLQARSNTCHRRHYPCPSYRRSRPDHRGRPRSRTIREPAFA